MPDFMGKDGFVWWQGVVEDRHDPLYLGRCRIRILGWHTDNKTEMPSEALPWAYPIQPIISAAQTGVGISPTGPVEGTWVVGFYRDGEAAQEPVFFGTLGGIPEDKPDNRQGFNDPRVSTEAELDTHPLLKDAHKLLSYYVDEDARVPRAPRSIKFYTNEELNSFEGEFGLPMAYRKMSRATKPAASGPTGVVQVVVEEVSDRSGYPDFTHINEPTTPRLARGIFGNLATTGPLSEPYGTVFQKKAWVDSLPNAKSAENDEEWKVPDPATLYGARYPYNHVHQSESGHITEIDDTPGKERLHRYHRMGTYEEIGSLGQRIINVVNEDFRTVMSNDYERIFGSQYSDVAGKVDISAKAGVFIHSQNGLLSVKNKEGTSFEHPSGSFSVVGNAITLNAADGEIILKAKSITTSVKTAVETNKVTGNRTDEIGGKHTVRAGSLALNSTGSTAISATGGVQMMATDGIQMSSMNLLGAIQAQPAYKLKSTIGSLLYECALPGLEGGLALNVGVGGSFGSIEIDMLGQIVLKGAFGLSKLTLGATGITLDYLGVSKLELTATGVTLSGLTTTVGGSSSVTTDVKGVAVTVEGTGVTTVKGSLVMIN